MLALAQNIRCIRNCILPLQFTQHRARIRQAFARRVHALDVINDSLQGAASACRGEQTFLRAVE
jgi:hypothetical protein